jgi:hypothetical protein
MADREIALKLSHQWDPTLLNVPARKVESRATARPFATSSRNHEEMELRFSKLRLEQLEVTQPRAECNVCFTGTKKYITAPCQDVYCYDCITHLFVSATTDQTLLPVRCCKLDISPDMINGILTARQRDAFDLSFLEYTTLNPVYCRIPTCSAFIKPATINDELKIASCEACETSMCTGCSEEVHPDRDCEADVQASGITLLAQENGWKSCERCHRMVELLAGCYHITCLCGNFATLMKRKPFLLSMRCELCRRGEAVRL